MSDIISAVCWVPRVAAKTRPIAFEMSRDEMDEVYKMEGLNINEDEQEAMDVLDSEEDAADGNSDDGETGGLSKELDMDNYDEATDIFAGDGGRAEAEVKANDGDDLIQGDDADSDDEDFNLKPSDKLLLAARTEDDYSCLEVYVYDTENGSLYVHHDITLPAFPLCMTWMGCGPEIMGENSHTGSRSYVAIGTFKPEIEIWNLDVLDALEPNVILGGFQEVDEVEAEATSNNKTKKGKKGKKNRANKASSSGDPLVRFKDGSHKDAIMGLSWNATHQNLLASCSADNTAKLWDVNTQACVKTWEHHTDKVQTVAWNPVEPTILLTGAFDQTVAVFDARQDNNKPQSFNLTSDVECVIWDVFNPAQFYVSTEDGHISCFDVRATDRKALYSFKAHTEAVSSITQNQRVPGMLASSSVDKTVKIWDLNTVTSNGGASAQPSLVTEKHMAVGPVFDCKYTMDDAFILACGGGKGMVALWDTVDDANVDETFSPRVLAKSNIDDKIVPANDDDDEEEGDAQPQAEQEASMEEEVTTAKKGKKKNKNKSK